MTKVLIVDDEDEFLKSCTDALNSINKYKLFVAKNSKDAFKIIKKKKIDVLIVDYLLKGDPLNGDKIIQIIREDEKKNNYKYFLPCIFITGTEGKKQFEPRFSNLQIKFHYKDDGPAELIKKIDECIDEKKARKNKIAGNKISNIKKYIVYPLIVAILGILIKFTIDIITQKNVNTDSISVNVISEQNIPIGDAKIIIEGVPGNNLTDDNGYTSIKITKHLYNDREILLIVSKDGFIPVKKSILVTDKKHTIVLKKNLN